MRHSTTNDACAKKHASLCALTSQVNNKPDKDRLVQILLVNLLHRRAYLPSQLFQHVVFETPSVLVDLSATLIAALSFDDVPRQVASGHSSLRFLDDLLHDIRLLSATDSLSFRTPVGKSTLAIFPNDHRQRFTPLGQQQLVPVLDRLAHLTRHQDRRRFCTEAFRHPQQVVDRNGSVRCYQPRLCCGFFLVLPTNRWRVVLDLDSGLCVPAPIRQRRTPSKSACARKPRLLTTPCFRAKRNGPNRYATTVG
jgi:hypothetical protein